MSTSSDQTPSPTTPPPGFPTLRERLRAALPPAMRARDRIAVSALRATLSALDNAEAVQPDTAAGQSLAIEDLPRGVGATETPRRVLTGAQVETIVRAEIAEREAAALTYDRVAQPEQARRLRAEAAVLDSHLAG